MAGQTGTKIAMFFAGMGALDLVIDNFLNFSISDFITGYIPSAYQSFSWIIFAIYGIAGVYTIYKTFSK